MWGYSNVKQIEVFYRKLLKEILKVDTSAPSCFVYGDTGTMPIVNHIINRMLSFYAKLCNGKQSKLSYILYKVMRKRHDSDENFESPWIDMVENCFNELGMSDFWLNECMGFSNEYIKKAVKLKVQDIYKQEWHMQVLHKDTCDYYSKVKDTHEF